MTIKNRSSLMALGLMTVFSIEALQVNAVSRDSENLTSSAQQEESASSCITCHMAMEGPETQEGVVHDFRLSAHASAGLDCSDCHGGNSSVTADLEGFDYSNAKGPGTGFRGVPDRDDIPSFCGRCHSDPEYMRQYAPQQRVDQEQLYLISGHGRELQRGNMAVATCVDCHNPHLILGASDPRSTIAPQKVPITCERCHSDTEVMAGSRLSTAIGEEYNGSVHGIALLERGDIGAPACNDCHGNHGAAPPGFSSVSAVCSQCHLSTASDFQSSPHGDIFEAMGEPQCEACHGNHTISKTSDAMLAEDGICSNCHGPGDSGFTAAATMLQELNSLKALIAEADSLLNIAQRKGMEIGEGRFTLIQAENSLIRSRAAVHTFVVNTLREAVAPGMEAASEAGAAGRGAIVEFGQRRRGWEVFLLLCVVVVVGMWILIRRMEGPGGSFPMREPE